MEGPGGLARWRRKGEDMIETRAAQRSDVQGMADVINPIIAAGGTTAFEAPLSAADVAGLTFDQAELVSVFVALRPNGSVGAFQYLGRKAALGPDIGDIASFSDLKGAGRALMARTIEAARAAGLREINAQIRADNVPGLAFYTGQGFQDHDLIKGVPLSDGTPVDRVVKRLQLV